MRPAPWATFATTLLALLAFAGNSLLCRLALREEAIDPIAFTTLRIASGMLVLSPFLPSSSTGRRLALGAERAWLGAGALLAYALFFSLAYVTLDAGIGALLLFGAVQGTMLGAGFLRGERMNARQLAGALAAVAGLLVLLLPIRRDPETRDALFMLVAGVAWGVYSLHGRHVASARVATARNFLLATPVVLVVFLASWSDVSLSWTGALLAALSGAVTSGLGYLVWYSALRGHSATSAGLVQLAVPVLAAAGGVAILGETWTGRATLAALLTLGGIALAVTARGRKT